MLPTYAMEFVNLNLKGFLPVLASRLREYGLVIIGQGETTGTVYSSPILTGTTEEIAHSIFW